MRKIWKPLGKQAIPQTLYLTYRVFFPNGVEWIRQEPIVHGLEHKLQQLQAEHVKDDNWKERFHMLKNKGEMWWKDSHKIEHYFKIEKTKRKDRWGVGATKNGSISKEDAAISEQKFQKQLLEVK